MESPEADARFGSRLILHPPAQPLRDATIVVRLPCQRDVEALVRYGGDPDVKETIWVPIPTPCSRAQAAERIDEFNRGWQTQSQFGPALIVAGAGTDEMIGIVFLRLRDGESVELSYGVAAAHRNRGVATAAVSLVARWCLDELKAARVELRIGQSNLASQHVAAKAGFTREGIVRSQLAATGDSYDDFLFTLR
jgi:RimJ/RimL family protein N-acetyltransferase